MIAEIIDKNFLISTMFELIQLDKGNGITPSLVITYKNPFQNMRKFLLVFGLISWLVFSIAYCQPNPKYDLLILNGQVMEGGGNPWFYADIAIVGDQIVKIGNLKKHSAETILDATGKIVAPGFIDIHSHADDGAFGNRRGIRADNPMMKAAHNLVMQGVTTVVVNQDGRSPTSIGLQRKEMEEEGVGPNVALLVGHNSIRRRALGPDYKRLATAEEIKRMKESIQEGLEAGAFGLSAGLEYIPGRWSNTDEVIELVKELKPHGGVYIVHERFSGSDPMWYVPSRDGDSPGTILDNVREVIRVAETTGVTSCATHLKVKGADFWGVSTAIVNLINSARARGVDIWADQYPYNTTGTDGNTVLLPDWAFLLDRYDRTDDNRPNYADALEAVLTDEENLETLRLDVLREIERRGGPENVIVFEHPDTSLIGKSIAQVADEKNLDLVETAVYLQHHGDPDRRGGGRLRGFSLSEQDIEILAAQPWLITASDAGIALPGRGSVHARYYGTFPRKIAWYAKHRKVLTVEDAVRSMTSLPAQFMGFKDRGMLKEGYRADICIFDHKTVKDNATFFEPHQYPDGIEQVIVNGQFLVKDGKLQEGLLPGKVLDLREDSWRN